MFINRQVDILNNNGFCAYVLHSEKDFRCKWFKNSTKIAYIPNTPFTSSDYLVLPEILGPNLAENAQGMKKIIFNQNAYYSFQGYSFDLQHFINPYSHNEVLGVITVSEDSKKYLKYALQYVLKKYSLDEEKNTCVNTWQTILNR